MVHTGRPSLGCSTCRKRKIKCDGSRPVCLQCSRSKKICLGWRDVNETFFRDENEATLLRIRRKDNSRKPKSLVIIDKVIWPNQEINGDTFDFLSPKSVLPFSSLIQNPTEPPETCALNFYIGAMVPKQTTVVQEQSGHMVYIPQLYMDSSSDSALNYAIKTVALAALSKFTGNDEHLNLAAHEMYKKALRTVRIALCSPEQMMQNSTLMSIMIMITAESLLASTEAPEDQWNFHIYGLVSLLKIRGPALIDDPVAARLFLVVRTFIEKGSKEQGIPMDEFLDQPTADWQSRLGRILESVPYKLYYLNSFVAPLRARTLILLQGVQRKQTTVDVWSILNELQDLEERFLDWRNSLAKQYQYEIAEISTESIQPACNGNTFPWMITIHQYATARIARMWNDYRSGRIFINTLIVRCLKVLMANADVLGDFRISRHLENLQELVNGVCATIPLSVRPDSQGHHNTTGQGHAVVGDPVEDATDAFFILWPLFVARGVFSINESQQDWIKSCMRNIADVYQLRQAISMLEIVDRDPKRPLEVELWDVKMMENTWENAYAFGYGGV